MNKFFKILTAMAVVIAIVGCVCAFVACNEKTNDGEDDGVASVEYVYKFTVVDEEGNPATGVQVQLCNSVTDTCKFPKDVDENGVAFFYEDDGKYSITADVWDIHVLTDGTDYVFDDTVTLQTSLNQKDYTVTVSK